ncbi:MAG TPA: hydantoinase/oxoprolinase family protein [Candidatus Rubrimentiphilum sp.]|nr:hydantoinase/oxoprolinase family protein [Candidatus Rubrimentiphilum sp.]
MAAAILRVGIDVGGTFTDVAAVDIVSGERIALKVSSTPQAPELGVVSAIRSILAMFPEPPQFEHIAHSTTIATNALLGQIHLELPRVVFLTTAGFRDVIEIGRQNRSEVYNLFVTRPKPLVARGDRIAVRERMDYRGNVLVALDQDEIERAIAAVRERNPASIAVGFLHSYVNGDHERTIGAALARAFPGIPITLSCEIDPEYREYERFSTAVVNAALTPIVRGYIERLAAALKDLRIDAPLYVMQSNGGLADARRIAAIPAAIIESGPASGAIAAADLARAAGIDRAISFDMGGTSAKAGTIAGGAVQIASEFEAAGSTHSGRGVKGSGYPVRFPFVDLAEISAGGGTIAFVDEAGALRVGPLSAGADPGPACYGKSERATVTDANVVLGRLNQIALAGGTFPIDAQRSHAAIGALARRIGLSTEETAAGIVRIVDSQMARVLHIVTTERGLDPRDFSLVAFGGNGPLHACALAAELGVQRIVIPRGPGVFSAHGLLAAPLQISLVRSVLRAADLTEVQLAGLFDGLETQARSALCAQGAANGAVSMRRTFDARYQGQSFELEVEGTGSAARAFHDEHLRRYGYCVEDEPVELVSARLTATAALAELPGAQRSSADGDVAESRKVWLDGAYAPASVHHRASLSEGSDLTGPALIEEADSCTYVAPGWKARVEKAALMLERA